MGSARTALVIEDDDDIRRLLEIVLGQLGLEVRSAATGRDGLASAADGPAPDLVTVDVGLPDIDGHDVVRELRTSYDGPIVMISARSTPNDRATGIAAGATDYLTKPFRPRELRIAIESVLATSERADR